MSPYRTPSTPVKRIAKSNPFAAPDWGELSHYRHGTAEWRAALKRLGDQAERHDVARLFPAALIVTALLLMATAAIMEVM